MKTLLAAATTVGLLAAAPAFANGAPNVCDVFNLPDENTVSTAPGRLAFELTFAELIPDVVVGDPDYRGTPTTSGIVRSYLNQTAHDFAAEDGDGGRHWKLYHFENGAWKRILDGSITSYTYSKVFRTCDQPE